MIYKQNYVDCMYGKNSTEILVMFFSSFIDKNLGNGKHYKYNGFKIYITDFNLVRYRNIKS